MRINPFEADDLRTVAQRWRLPVDSVLEIAPVIDRIRGTYERVHQLATASLSPEPRPAGVTMLNRAACDPHGAWMYRIDSPQVPEEGPLAGRTFTIKESIAVQGVPMTLGSRLMADFVPGSDADVVRRIRAAGGTILGTSVCEDLCYSGSSFTSVLGPVTNPWDDTRASGGSTSGASVLVATGQADYGIGTDVGGSVRNPAAWCGIVGLKPTFGALPYDGAMPTERTMDHIGILTRHAADLPVLLDALADPPPSGTHGSRFDADIEGLHVGLLSEGFGWPGRSDARVDDAVRRAGHQLADLGMPVTEVSVPLHRHGHDIHVPILLEGGLTTVFETRLQGNNHLEGYHPKFAATFGAALTERPEDLGTGGLVALVSATLLRDATNGVVAAYAQWLRARLRQQVDAALDDVDVLVLPTVPMLAHKIPDNPHAATVYGEMGLEMHDNNCVFNLTGHPAISVPCALVDGLPVGMMLVGHRNTEGQLARIAHEFEKRVYGISPPPARS